MLVAREVNVSPIYVAYINDFMRCGIVSTDVNTLKDDAMMEKHFDALWNQANLALECCDDVDEWEAYFATSLFTNLNILKRP